MFGNNGSTSDGWMDALVERRQRLKQLDETRTIRDKHHTEMMDLIGQYNELREKFQKLEDNAAFYEADRDAACSVIKELRTRLGISKEEVISELDNRRNSILKERGYEYMCD